MEINLMKKATSRDVAKLAGVSQTTVSFVINNTPGVSLSEETRKKVLSAVKELNYVPNSFAKSLKTNESKLIGLLVPTMINPFYPMLAQYIEKYAATRGYNVLLCCTYSQAEREDSYLDLISEKGVDGIIYTFSPHYLKHATKLSRCIPIVLMSEKSDDIHLNTISLNGFQCGVLIAQHLLELGHRSIAYIMSPVKSVSLTRERRLEGIRSTLMEFGLPSNALKVYSFETIDGYTDGSLETDAGYKLTERLIRETDVTAIIGVNDMVALGAISCLLNDRQLRVPEDISVCGFDNSYLSDMLRPKITTVDYRAQYLSKLAVDMLVDASTTEENHGVLKLESEPRLVVRESTGPARPRKPLDK